MPQASGLFRQSRRGRWSRLLGYGAWLPRPQPHVTCGLTAGICLLILLALLQPDRASSSHDGPSRSATRHLLMQTLADRENSTFYNYRCERIPNSTKGHLTWETCNFEKSTGGTVGWILLYILATLIIFVALAIVCDDFFVPSLEAISEKLQLSEDVAGATFMAAGSSAPELFSSIAAVSFDSDAGIGTIAGSAVFNLLVIISLTAAFAGQVLHLDWRPLARDAFFYLISIIFFIYMVLDSVVQWWEAAVLLVLYGLYILTMVFNARLMDLLANIGDGLQRSCFRTDAEADLAAEQPNGGGSGRRPSTLSNASARSEDMKVFRHDRRNSVVLHIAGAKPMQQPQQQQQQQQPKNSSSLHMMQQQRQLSPNRIVNGNAADTMAEKAILPEEDDANDTDAMTEAAAAAAPLAVEKVARCKSRDRVEFCDPPVKRIIEPDDEAGKKVDGVDEAAVETTEWKAEEEEDGADDEAEAAAAEARMRSCCACCPDIRGAPPKKSSGGPVETALLALKWILFVVAFPFLCLFSWTIPECSREDLKKYFMVSFLVSVLWIAALSFAMVTIVARMGCLMGVDTFVMSLVVLAAGTSIPDLLSSIIVARDGFGDMAVSNAIGSNVFDIDLGLGLPFLIKACINKGQPLDMFSDSERRTYCENKMKLIPHVKFGIILIALLAVCMGVIVISRFRLGRLIGVSFFAIYLGFLVYAFCQEFLCNFDC